MKILHTFDIVTGGLDIRVMANCKLAYAYCAETGFFIDDMGCLDAPNKIPSGELIPANMWSEYGPQQRIKYRMD